MAQLSLEFWPGYVALRARLSRGSERESTLHGRSQYLRLSSDRLVAKGPCAARPKIPVPPRASAKITELHATRTEIEEEDSAPDSCRWVRVSNYSFLIPA